VNFKTITAYEAMNADVITLREDATVKEAIATLEEYHITGAPVVNSIGECVGVFSTSDLLRRRRELDEGESPESGGYFSSDPLTDDPDEFFLRQDYDEAVLGQDTVGQWMTGEIKSVLPGTPLERVCRRMLDERVHRLLVMEGKKLEGIITTFDIVRLAAGNVAGKKGDKRATETRKRTRV
jgi:CBS domain-containing protein